MWECYHCGFQNVDAAPVCGKCRARKPLPGEKPKGRSFYAAEIAAQSRYADEVMAQTFPPVPAAKQLREKWQEAAANPVALHQELAKLDQRSYAVREAIRLLINVLRNPQARGVEEQLVNVINTLMDWEREA
jgi:hypothetical protein